MPLSGRHKTLERFLKFYQTECINRDKFTYLLIVLYEDDDDYKENKLLIENSQIAYGKDKIAYVTSPGKFSRAKALERGINFFKNEDLLFLLDVDIIFSEKTLQRVRFNTVRHKKVYFPIVYSLYNVTVFNKTSINYNDLHFESLVDEDSGFWRQFGFGIVSIYKSDYKSVGGLNTSITGWGMEDVNFYDNIIKSQFKIIRSVDPDLIHVYHSVICDNNLDLIQKNMCLGTKASTFGSLYDLQNYYIKNKHLFR